MSEIKHIWACSCGAETPCRPEDMRLGAVWECPRCRQVWGCVYPSRGGKAWVTISDDDVAFHDLLGRNHRYDDDEEEEPTIRSVNDELGQILAEALRKIGTA